MVRIWLDGDEVEVEPLGLHKLWALKGRLRFKQSNIRNVAIAGKSLRPPLLRMPGTHVPGLFAAGTYRWKARREFWDVVYRKEAVVIDLSGEKYTRVVVNVADPSGVVKLLTVDE